MSDNGGVCKELKHTNGWNTIRAHSFETYQCIVNISLSDFNMTKRAWIMEIKRRR